MADLEDRHCADGSDEPLGLMKKDENAWRLLGRGVSVLLEVFGP